MSTTPTSTCAIRARDFSHSTTDTLRDDWTAGKMRHVIDALDGEPVAITVDRLTGHTMLGVRLIRVEAKMLGGMGVLVEADLSDGTTQRTLFDLWSIGDTIVPMGDRTGRSDAKWTALDSHRREGSAAITIAKERHPEWSYGKFEATPYACEVHVSYTRQRDDAGPRFAYEAIRLSDLSA